MYKIYIGYKSDAKYYLFQNAAFLEDVAPWCRVAFSQGYTDAPNDPVVITVVHEDGVEVMLYTIDQAETIYGVEETENIHAI